MSQVYRVTYTIYQQPEVKETIDFNEWHEARGFERENSHMLRSCDISQHVIQDVFSFTDLLAKT